jgi:uncharacterized protein
MDDKFFDKLRKKILPYFEGGGSHEFSHTERVYNMSILISKDEKVDMDIIRAAALLHDIAREKQDSGEVDCHAEEGAKMAGEILKDIDFPKEKIAGVVHSIAVHRYSGKAKIDSSEAYILRDADRLDALGAITIGRMFATGGKMGIPLYDPEVSLGKLDEKGYSKTVINGFYDRILTIKPEILKTAKAREIAKERYEYVKGFVERFKKEWEGKL